MRLKKALGQHILTNEPILSSIASNICDDTVIEIGPGTGNLTKHLLQNNHITRLVLVEKDPEMIEILKERFSDPRLETVNADATKISLKDFGPQNFRCSIVGNLPYNVGNSIVINLTEQMDHIAKVVVMLQKEVVRRLCAAPKTKDYGKLTILCGLFCNAKKIMDVGPKNFVPPPSVMSSVLLLTPKTHNISDKEYSDIVKICNIGFGQRRKKLLPLLKQFFRPEQIGCIASILPSPDVRIEELDINSIVALARAL